MRAAARAARPDVARPARMLRLNHLARLTTPTGLFEHALGTQPRPEHGMCVDDVARALVVTARVPQPDAVVLTLTGIYLRFVVAAVRPGGLMHNRRSPDGRWLDEASNDDHWGRAVWALGTAAARLPDGALRDAALSGAAEAMRARSPHLRATAYAALGAAELVRVDALYAEAAALVRDARATLPAPVVNTPWPWPEPRLAYANAVVPEAMLAVGHALDDGDLRADGERLLRWLVTEQTIDGRLSLVPAGGRGPTDRRPGFDQQPIEVAALAEAATTALRVTGDRAWAAVLERCVTWFEGDNDSGTPVRVAATGGGFDGLERVGVNLNQGAESTLAWLATVQLWESALQLVTP